MTEESYDFVMDITDYGDDKLIQVPIDDLSVKVHYKSGNQVMSGLVFYRIARFRGGKSHALPSPVSPSFALIRLHATIYCAKITTTANNKKGLRGNGDLTDKRHPQKVLPTLLRELGINHPDPAAPFARMTYLFPL